VLTLILGEAELELVPPSIASHPAIVASARQRKKKTTHIILDASFHHSAMKKLEEGRRRGRPDITHIFLLTALDSIVNKRGEMNTIIHTRNNQAIYINPETRLIRHYPRFIGLMEQLFEKKIVGTEDKILLRLEEDVTLEKLVDEVKPDITIVLAVNGRRVNLPDYFNDLKKNNYKHILCVVGGFPSGGFHCKLKDFADDIVSIYDEMITAWTAASEIIVNYENTFMR